MADARSGSEEPRPSASDESRGVMPIEEFTALASKLVSLAMYREAIGLYETAVRLYPENVALKINIARVRDMKRRSDEQLLRDLRGNIQERREREDLLAQNALGLGNLHYRRNELEKARDYYEFARSCSPNLYQAHLALARIHVGRNEHSEAIPLLEEARRFNPFSEEVRALVGRLYFEKGENLRAIHSLLDALVLSGESLEDQPFYRRHVTLVLERLGFGAADLSALLQERQAKLSQLLDRIERRRRETVASRVGARQSSILAALSQQAAARPQEELLALRGFPFLTRASDDDLQALRPLITRKELAAGELLFKERESSRRLYLVEKGELVMRRATPFGDVAFASIVAGQVCGEMDFLDGLGHSADAVVVHDATILSFTRADAERLFAMRKELAVHCLSYFWKTLAEHIRHTNDQMKAFFADEARNADRQLDERQISKAEKVIIDIQKKLALFKEKGLSAGELSVLATLSTEERYNQGDRLFSEGESGAKLYVVLDGKVRIAKRIPGVGEEALAILERGDFFGEMSLIDDKPRSADAVAHENGTVVLAIDKRVLEDILSQDLAGAEQFLTILNRILCQRLREINETIVKWKIMSGGF